MELKLIEKDGIDFAIDEYGALQFILNEIKQAKVIIPHKFPSGEVINTIAEGFYFKGSGTVSNIYISDGITAIAQSAFEGQKVSSFRWPGTCPIIPKRCFLNCDIEKLSHIENVTVIEKEAFKEAAIKDMADVENVEIVGIAVFKGALIKSFTWPSKCSKIPDFCFSRSSIERISNIENVESIQKCAFSDTKLEEITWPSKCKKIPIHCFDGCHNLKSVSNIDNVEQVEEGAFYNTRMERFEWP